MTPPSLSPAEWDVMKVFWDRGPLAARDVHAALAADHDWASKTVKTMLARLVVKGALDYVAVGNSYLYRPCFTRDEVTRVEMEEFLDRVLDGAGGPALVHFIQNASLTEEDIARLRALLDEKQRQAARPARGGRK